LAGKQTLLDGVVPGFGVGVKFAILIELKAEFVEKPL
jgi:hypothetical protein